MLLFIVFRSIKAFSVFYRLPASRNLLLLNTFPLLPFFVLPFCYEVFHFFVFLLAFFYAYACFLFFLINLSNFSFHCIPFSTLHSLPQISIFFFLHSVSCFLCVYPSFAYPYLYPHSFPHLHPLPFLLPAVPLATLSCFRQQRQLKLK